MPAFLEVVCQSNWKECPVCPYVHRVPIQKQFPEAERISALPFLNAPPQTDFFLITCKVNLSSNLPVTSWLNKAVHTLIFPTCMITVLSPGLPSDKIYLFRSHAGQRPKFKTCRLPAASCWSVLHKKLRERGCTGWDGVASQETPSLCDHTWKGVDAVLAWARQNPETQLEVINTRSLVVWCFVCMKRTRRRLPRRENGRTELLL